MEDICDLIFHRSFLMLFCCLLLALIMHIPCYLIMWFCDLCHVGGLGGVMFGRLQNSWNK